MLGPRSTYPLSDVGAGEVFRAGWGYAVALPLLDWETYSEAGFVWNDADQKWDRPAGAPNNKIGLEVVGLRNYILHPTFDITSLYYDLLDGQGRRHWVPSPETFVYRADSRTDRSHMPPWAQPWALIDHVAAGNYLEAWNASFERYVWNLYCAPKWGWPALRIERTRCAMAKGRAHAGPGKLGEFARVFNLLNQKDPDGDRLLKKFAQPRKPTRKNPSRRLLPKDDPVDAERLYSYNGQDIATEHEASIKTPDLSPEELEIWQVDQIINQRGMRVDLAGVDNCIAIVEQAFARYNAELRHLTNNAVQEASKLEQIKTWARIYGVHLQSLDEEHIEELLTQKDTLPANVYRAIEIRALIGSASVKKLFAFRNSHHLGRLYDLYIYFGARTGRWTAVGPQPMNMPKGHFKTLEQVERALAVIAHRNLDLLEYEYPKLNALDVVASCLRGLIIADEGCDLICSDYSAIEGVVTAALAGEEWRLEVFRTHGMIYEASAASVTGVPFEEFVKHRLESGGVLQPNRSIIGGSHHPLRAQIGKFTELACGFGGWIAAMVRFDADEFLSEKEMKTAILKWRAASPNIVKLWGGQKIETGPWEYRPELHGIEGAAIAAVKWRGTAYEYRGIVYQMSEVDDVLYCRVPSGGFLTYHRPRLEPSRREWSQKWEVELSYEGWNNNPKMGPIGWVRMNWYGGKGTENVVQKEARAIQAHALVNLEKAGYRPVLHSHDEICGEVRKGWGSIEEFEMIASTLPAFARGWPVKMKGGWRGGRYGKFD